MKTLLITLLAFVTLPGCSQKKEDRSVGGRCENCEMMFSGMPASLKSSTTIAKSDEPGEPLTISGIIYKPDGKTPAEGVIIYVYHTDAAGYYSAEKGSTDNTRHGHLRGWMKTDKNGRYSFKTIRPASYPDSKAPQHVHILIKEDGIKPYWIDEIVFKDDPFVNGSYNAAQQNRGGPGLTTLTKNHEGVWTGERDIVLGKNVPGY